MAIVFSNLGASANPDINSSVDASSYANSSWTPPTSGLLWVWVHSARVSGPDTPTVTGNGVTWLQVGATLNAGLGRGLSLFAANATGSTAGVTTVTFGTTQLACIAAFGHATGVDLSGGVAAAFVQQVANSNTSNATSASLTLAAASSPANRALACFFHVISEGTTPRTNWTEGDDLSGTAYPRGLITQWRTDAFETTASASWLTGSGWGGMAVELKATNDPVTITVTDTIRATSNLELTVTLADNELNFTSTFRTTALANMQGVYGRIATFIAGFGENDPLQFWNGTGAVPAIESMFLDGIDRYGAIANILGLPLDWIIWRLPWQFTEHPVTGVNSVSTDYYQGQGEARRIRADRVADYQTYIRRLGKYLMETYGARRFKVGSEMKGFQQDTVNGLGQTWDYELYYDFYAVTREALLLAADDAGVARADILTIAPYPVVAHQGVDDIDSVDFDTRNTVTAPIETIRYKDDAVPPTWNMNNPPWAYVNKAPLQAIVEFFKLCAANGTPVGMYSTDFGMYQNDNVIKLADDFADAEDRTRSHWRWAKRLLQDIAGGQFAELLDWMDAAEIYWKSLRTIAPGNYVMNPDGTQGPPVPEPPEGYIPEEYRAAYQGALKAIGLAVCVEEGIRTPSLWTIFGSGDARTYPKLWPSQYADEQRHYGAAIVREGQPGAGTLTVVGQILKWFNEEFSAGTPIYEVEVSDPSRVYAIPNATNCIVTNKTGVDQPININGNESTLAPYQTAKVEYNQAYTGALAVTLPSLTFVATGTFAVPTYAGTAALTLPSLAIAAAGTFTVPVYTGTATITLPSLTLALEGEFSAPVYVGELALALPSLQMETAGEFTPPQYAGELAITLPALTLAMTGVYDVTVYIGSLAMALPNLTIEAAGTFDAPVYEGDLAVSLPSLALEMTGDYLPPPIEGTLAVTLPMILMAITGHYSFGFEPYVVEAESEVVTIATANVETVFSASATVEMTFIVSASVEL